MQLSLKPQADTGIYWLGIYLVSFAFAIYFDGISKYLVATYFIHFFIFSFGIAFGLHRCLVHGNGPWKSWTVKAASLIGVLANVGSPISWVVTHTQHHRFSDLPLDPQNAAEIGPALIYGELRERDIGNLGSDFFSQTFTKVSRDKYYLFLHNYYYLIQIVFILLGFLVGGRKGILYFCILPTGLSFLTLGFLNYFCHINLGYQNHHDKNKSKNNLWLFFLMFGENWHNNHHHSPARNTTRESWWELDLTYCYFVILKWFFPRDWH